MPLAVISQGAKALRRWHCGEPATILAKASTDRYHAPQEVNAFAKMTVRVAPYSPLWNESLTTFTQSIR